MPLRLRSFTSGCLALLVAFGLSGCAEDQSPLRENAASDLHAAVPPMIEDMSHQADLKFSYSRDREWSCLRPENKEQQRQTYWIVSLEAAVANRAAGKAAVDAATEYLVNSGWDHVSVKPPEPQGLEGGGFRKGDPTISVGLFEGDNRFHIEVLAMTTCFKNPKDHRMTRSPNDPDYGTSSSYYDHLAEQIDE